MGGGLDVPIDGPAILIAERGRTVRQLEECLLRKAGLLVHFADHGRLIVAGIAPGGGATFILRLPLVSS